MEAIKVKHAEGKNQKKYIVFRFSTLWGSIALTYLSAYILPYTYDAAQQTAFLGLPFRFLAADSRIALNGISTEFWALGLRVSSHAPNLLFTEMEHRGLEFLLNCVFYALILTLLRVVYRFLKNKITIRRNDR